MSDDLSASMNEFLEQLSFSVDLPPPPPEPVVNGLRHCPYCGDVAPMPDLDQNLMAMLLHTGSVPACERCQRFMNLLEEKRREDFRASREEFLAKYDQ